MESIEDQPTSSVPKNKSDYTEPYDPSMARGLAGIAVAGAGAFALRNPIGRVIQKIANIKLPKAPAPRTSAPDKVDEVLEIAPTKMEVGKGHDRRPSPRRILLRAVRILLECILVFALC